MTLGDSCADDVSLSWKVWPTWVESSPMWGRPLGRSFLCTAWVLALMWTLSSCRRWPRRTVVWVAGSMRTLTQLFSWRCTNHSVFSNSFIVIFRDWPRTIIPRFHYVVVWHFRDIVATIRLELQLNKDSLLQELKATKCKTMKRICSRITLNDQPIFTIYSIHH